MHCQCENISKGHLHQGHQNSMTEHFISCNNQATEKVITSSGRYYLCKKCADEYQKDGYVYQREKLH